MKMSSRIFSAVAAATGFLFFGHAAEGQANRPNIVVIAADDMGGASMAIWKGEWKLVKTGNAPAAGDVTVVKDLSGAELYNLKDDIGEQHNLAAAHPEIVKEPGDVWQRWNKELAKPGWPPPGPAQVSMALVRCRERCK